MNHAENDAGERSPRTERSYNPLPISDLQTPPKGWRITHEFDETPRDDGATGPCYLGAFQGGQKRILGGLYPTPEPSIDDDWRDGLALTTAELSAGLAMPARWMRAPSGLTRQSCGEPASARACSSSRATKWRRHLHAEDVARRSAAPVNRKRTRAATRRSVADQEQPVPEGDRIRRPRTRGDRALTARPKTGNKHKMEEQLTTNDASVLKFALAVVLEARLGYSRKEIEALSTEVATPSEGAETVVERLGRLRLNGKAVFKVHNETKKGELYHEFEYLIHESDVPGGSRTVVDALLVRMYELLGTPVPADEREDAEDEPAAKATVDKLAASLALEPRKTVVH